MEAFEAIVRLLFAISCFVMIGSVTRTSRKASRRGRREPQYGRDMNGKARKTPYSNSGMFTNQGTVRKRRYYG